MSGKAVEAAYMRYSEWGDVMNAFEGEKRTASGCQPCPLGDQCSSFAMKSLCVFLFWRRNSNCRADRRIGLDPCFEKAHHLLRVDLVGLCLLGPSVHRKADRIENDRSMPLGGKQTLQPETVIPAFIANNDIGWMLR